MLQLYIVQACVCQVYIKRTCVCVCVCVPSRPTLKCEPNLMLNPHFHRVVLT